ncbi:MAG: DUF1801 domain-containing protein [Verrucomicrobiaceae bacterium]|nr:DUF1801 domain-containing protein [Verrucomicrobiaceae bacterium]
MSTPKTKRSVNTAKPVKLLTGGNPQIAKGDGDAVVLEYIAAMPGWKSAVGRRLLALIKKHLPKVQMAVRWNSPFFGIEGQGWLVSFHVVTKHVKLNFFSGTSLKPAPPCGGKDPNARWLNISEGEELDEAQITEWLKQVATMNGWASFSA